jgi:hypothetical protein
VHDLARVMRVPGTLNHKQSPPAPVTLRDNGQLRRYAFSDLDEWLPPGMPAPLPGGRKPPPPADVGDDELDRLAASYAAGDERFAKTWARERPQFGSASEYDLAVCVKAADMGADDATCWALVRRWRQLHGEDPAKAERADYAAATLAKARAGEPPATRADTPGERAIVQSPPPLAENPQILNAFGTVIRRRGVVGEVAIARLLYLVVTTRLLDRQVSAVVKGHTSSGKSWTLDQVLQFFPPGAFLEITAMSEKALVYLKEEFAHRTIVVFEAVALREGVKDDMTAYLVRSLLSEGRIRYPVTVRGEDGNWTSRYIVRDGPTNLVLTTTQTRVHEENETRVLSLTTDDSREQTRRVMRELASESGTAVDLSEWQQLQAWLEDAGERRVTIPYAPALAELIPPVAVRLRRDFGAVLALIRAHAILHQCSRAQDAAGRVVASLEDYGVVRDLVADVLAEGVGSTISVTTREAVVAVAELLPAHEDGVPHAGRRRAAEPGQLGGVAASPRCARPWVRRQPGGTPTPGRALDRGRTAP